MNASTVMAAGIGLLLGITLGALFWAWRLRLKASDMLPLPQRWPLRARAVVNDNEKEVWQALRSIFHDHVVMVKMPVLRFTRLRDTEKAGASVPGGNHKAKARRKREQWLEKLGGLYTTFTVCTLEGKVVGCVDVPGKLALTKASRELKEALLLECGIAYTVVNAFNLPDAGVMRELFLGEIPAVLREPQVTRGGDSEFHADLAAFAKAPQAGH